MEKSGTPAFLWMLLVLSFLGFLYFVTMNSPVLVERERQRAHVLQEQTKIEQKKKTSVDRKSHTSYEITEH
jgi:hypothetical protein